MAYEAYVTIQEYIQLFPDAPEVTQEELRQASRYIDSLTFNRIVAAGFNNLTAFQQEVIKETVCRQVLFEKENKDLLESVLSSYSINGVNMSFGDSWNVIVQDGVAMSKDVYALLRQTGLCYRAIGG